MNATSGSFLSNRVYDILKYVAQILLPAFGTLYFALADLWGLPARDQVVGTVVAVDTFLGVVLRLSSHAYSEPVDGEMVVVDGEDGAKTVMLELNQDAHVIADKQMVRFQVKGPSGEVAP